jgi:hypothetical protein
MAHYTQFAQEKHEENLRISSGFLEGQDNGGEARAMR